MFKTLLNEWHIALQNAPKSNWLTCLENGSLTLAHYKGYLLETYHHAGMNPQIQAFATMYFKGNPRKIHELFYRHAISEIGHDLMALEDLKSLGEDEAKLRNTRPLPSTIAYNAFVLHQIQFVDPVCYLGYLFHLEYLPTQLGPQYIEKLKSLGIPEGALTFLYEHSKVDVSHNKLMEIYINELVTKENIDNVLYSLNCSVILHNKMIDDSISNGGALFSEALPARKSQSPYAS